MANIQERKNKFGEIISYSIRVYKGRDPYSGKQLKPFTKTWRVPEGWSEKRARKEAEKQAALFEQDCLCGAVSDNRQSFAEYADYVIRLKERSGKKHRTIAIYRDLMKRIVPAIGYLKLSEIRPQHLNQFYELLSREGMRDNSERAQATVDLKALLAEYDLSLAEAAHMAGVCTATMTRLCQGKPVMPENARRLANVLEKNPESLFTFYQNESPLNSRTVLEYHRFISTVLAQADREMLIPFNPASKATPPRTAPYHAHYFQQEDLIRIREALESEPIHWRVMVHLLLITGCRRGEIMGLKWDAISWDSNQLHIQRTLLYSSDIGVYEDTTKTEESNRYIKLPAETMLLLKEYRNWYAEIKANAGIAWQETGFLFVKPTGQPLHPSSLTRWLLSFSRRRELPHICPHAFRHTQASILFYNGVDSVTISKRLGHSKVSTTADIYSHLMQMADERASECVAEILLR